MDQIIKLLETENYSKAYYELLYRAHSYSTNTFGGKGYVFAQIGINAAPCSVNCSFCSMGCGHYMLPNRWEKSIAEIEQEAMDIVASGVVSDLFIMTTADYPLEIFLEVGAHLSLCFGSKIRLVANIGDFDISYAHRLKEVGFDAIYHIVRLGEEIDTQATISQRIATIENARTAGLKLYYCIEPIGPEHTYQQIAQEILRAKSYHVDVMAVMRRTAVIGTPLFNKGEISVAELCKIAAVTMLTVQPNRSMNVHEIHESSLLMGVNQLYAEIGANPRDIVDTTELSRGYSLQQAADLLLDFGYTIGC